MSVCVCVAVAVAAVKVRAIYARFLAVDYTLVLSQTYCKGGGNGGAASAPHPDPPPSTVRSVRS